MQHSFHFLLVRRSRELCVVVLAIALAGIAGCRVTDLQIWRPVEPVTPDSLPVKEIRDISYRDEAKTVPFRHKLDLFLPKDKKDFPVVVLVHGGAWIIGDNRCCGLYSSVGHFLASQGIGAVLPNYRLSPGVKHPNHVQDVAKVLAWTRAHIGEHGGNPDRIILLGHSAGGHLVSLLATDETYLKAEGLKTSDIKGVISVVGVYKIPPGEQKFTLGGTSPLSLRWDQMYPLHGDGSKAVPEEKSSGGILASIKLFSTVFGDDAQVRIQASPLTHVRRGLPPFLILGADKDLPTLPGMAKEFHQALVREGCDARLLVIEKRNHNSIMFNVTRPDDPAAQAILDFIKSR